MDESKYAQLLSDARPRVIETEEEHERLMGIAEQLMDKGAALGPEEEALVALLVLLIEAYETSAEEDEDEERESHEPAKPHETLKRLLEARGLHAADVGHFFGNARLAAEVLTGQRPISRGQAKELGKFFQVPPKLFHS